MGNYSRRALSTLKWHLTKAERERRSFEESLIKVHGEDLDEIRPDFFVNTAARAEYLRTLESLRASGSLVGSLCRADLIAYSNSFGRYQDLIKLMRRKDYTHTVETKDGPKANPLEKMLDETRRDMAASSGRLGMTVQAMQSRSSSAAEDLPEIFAGI